MYYSKEINVDNVKEELKKEVSDETCQDIEDFLLPKFDTHVHLYGRRKWRIVQDGHGRWREINTDTNIQENKCNNTVFTNEGFAKSVTPASRKLSFSNHVLNTVTSSSKPACDSRSSHRHDSNYKTLSTTTRANIFPGIGKHNWDSQSNMVYTDSALKLGDLGGHDLQDGFYGITKDSLGAWNEASVHHERMKKAWDVYLESLAKTGGGR